jgi:hypothetical protein
VGFPHRAQLYFKTAFLAAFACPALEIAQNRHDFPGTRSTRVLVNRAIRISRTIPKLKNQEEFHEVPSLA